MGPIASLADLLAALRRQAWVIGLVLALGLPAALWFALTRPPAFEAVAVIQIEPPEVAEAAGGAAPGLTANAQLDLIAQRLMARDTIAGLAERFGLFAEAGSATERVALLRGAITIQKLVDPAQAWRPEVQPSGLSIAVRLGDPEDAAQLANALVDEVVAEARARAGAVAAETLAFHRAEEARVGAAVAAVEEEIAAFRAANLPSLPDAVAAQRERLTRLTESRIALDRQVIEFEGGVDRLRPEEAERQRALLDEERGVLLAAIAETEGALAAAPAVERELGALSRRLEGLEAELSIIIADRRDAEVAQRLEAEERAGRFTVLETATPPEFAVSADRRRVAMAGGVAAGMLALGLALAREVLQPALRNAAQMRRQLGVEPVVVIPRLQTRGAALRRRLGLVAVFLAVAAGTAAVARVGLQAALDWLPRGARN